MKISEHSMSRHDKLTQSAQQMVADTFYGTMLKQMRQSPFRDPKFDGGRGGEAFNQLFDQKIAEKMAGRMHNPLVDSIVQKFEKGKSSPTAAELSKTPGSSAPTPALFHKGMGGMSPAAEEHSTIPGSSAHFHKETAKSAPATAEHSKKSDSSPLPPAIFQKGMSKGINSSALKKAYGIGA